MQCWLAMRTHLYNPESESLKICTLGTSSFSPSQKVGIYYFFRKAPELFRLLSLFLLYVSKYKAPNPNSKAQIKVLFNSVSSASILLDSPVFHEMILWAQHSWEDVLISRSKIAPRWLFLSTFVTVQAETKLIVLPGMKVYILSPEATGPFPLALCPVISPTHLEYSFSQTTYPWHLI